MVKSMLVVMGDDKLVQLMDRLLAKMLIRMHAAWQAGYAWVEAALQHWPHMLQHMNAVRHEIAKRGL